MTLPNQGQKTAMPEEQTDCEPTGPVPTGVFVEKQSAAVQDVALQMFMDGNITQMEYQQVGAAVALALSTNLIHCCATPNGRARADY